ncbi:hypothetical protein [Streptomyces sp. NPDC049915]|uniref:hypothetical protein n=1 Tax=Streptomyces sp. NPDC049915 TaxID=3155510 RepID=UPI0034245AB9
MPVRHRTRTLPARPRRLAAAAALVVLAAGALAGCRDGEGLRDEGPSSRALGTPSHASAAASLAPGAPQRSFWATSVAQ